jgi:regulator of RNase E activity RraA
MVDPDEVLHGDRNGITTIPRAIVTEVAQIADAFVAAEQIILDAVRTETASLARLRQARAEAHAHITALRTQVSRAR